ncbi:MAG: PIN domain-containing protein [Tenericutes bacterium]|nr:PIN domain-containing protein [Mycoplasmatota bacterium]
MICYIDTSAILAVFDADDSNHHRAKKQWETLVLEENTLVISNYVLVELIALLQHRLGIKAVRIFSDDIVPVLSIEWVNEATHHAGIMGVLTAARKKLSFVDCISFETMRQLGIKSVFAFDKHFKEQGFICIP